MGSSDPQSHPPHVGVRPVPSVAGAASWAGVPLWASPSVQEGEPGGAACVLGIHPETSQHPHSPSPGAYLSQVRPHEDILPCLILGLCHLN